MTILVNENELLFADRLAPLTTSMGFLQVDAQSAATEFTRWQREIQSVLGISVERRGLAGNLEELFRSVLPLRMADTTRELFVPTSSKWTAYFDNGYRGTDPSAIRHLAERLSCLTVWLVARPHTLRKSGARWEGRHGALLMAIYGPEPTEHLNLKREIRLQNDAGRWEFYLSGPPFPFEDVERYRARRKTDRFTFNMLKRYLGELGIRPFDENFYQVAAEDGASLVEHSGKLPATARDVSLDEARRLNGIED